MHSSSSEGGGLNGVLWTAGLLRSVKGPSRELAALSVSQQFRPYLNVCGSVFQALNHVVDN